MFDVIIHDGLRQVLHQDVLPGLKDPISKEIVKALFEKGDRNISQITEAVKARRGTASRRIVRDRLEAMERDGVVVASGPGKVRTFSVSQAVVDKWSQVLGLAKSQEQRTEERGEPRRAERKNGAGQGR